MFDLGCISFHINIIWLLDLVGMNPWLVIFCVGLWFFTLDASIVSPYHDESNDEYLHEVIESLQKSLRAQHTAIESLQSQLDEYQHLFTKAVINVSLQSRSESESIFGK